MVKLKIGEQEYGLRMDMYAMEMIEDEFGGMDELFKGMEKTSAKMVRKLFRILANAALAYEGKPETVTGDEMKQLRLSALNGISVAIRAAIDEGMKAETVGGEKADDEVYDVYLAEIEAKN